MKSFHELRIVFFGTPDFAVATLDALVQAGLNVVAVVTMPDKPAGRGKHIQFSPVKEYGLAHNIPVLQPEKMKNPTFVEELRSYHADLQVVVAFRMMPEVVWNMPPMGTLNVHGSLLPQYRGAAPINRAIMNGETETGVTTFKLKHEIDTGDIMLRHKVAILPEDNAGTLHDKLMVAGAQLMVETIQKVVSGEIVEIPQDNIPLSELKFAPKIFKEDTHINWNSPVKEILNFVRGLSPYPAAYSHIADKQIKVYTCHIEELANAPAPGTMETDGSNLLRFSGADGWVYIDEIQIEGKKRMDIGSFLRGFRA